MSLFSGSDSAMNRKVITKRPSAIIKRPLSLIQSIPRPIFIWGRFYKKSTGKKHNKSMPELPEVETIKQGLERQIVGRSILDVEAFDRLVLGSPKNEFIRRLKNKKVAAVSRRGKAIILTLEPKAFLVVQLAMTGQLIYGQKSSGSKVTLRLSNGKYLHYNDARRFGRLHALKQLTELKFLRNLGPEPLSKDFNVNWLKEQFKNRKSP